MRRYNIYHRKDGRFEGRLSKGKKRNGHRRFQYFFGKTRGEVEEKIDAYRLETAPKSDCTLTLKELFEEWFSSVQYRIKESTAANYRMKANKHILPKFGGFRISKLGSAEINAFVKSKFDAGFSYRYVADIVILMKSLFKYAVRVYHVFNPMSEVILPHRKSEEIRILDSDEQKRLSEYAEHNTNRTSLGIALSMNMGLRIGELCALQWRDVDLEKRVLTVRRTLQRIQTMDSVTRTKLILTDPKSESSKRSIPIPKFLIPQLTKFAGRSTDFILSGKEKPIEPRTMQYRFARVLKNAELPSVHFHALRHMFASNCVKLGFDVKTLSEILGHSSVETTLNRYVHSSFEQKVACMSLLERTV